jgi:hypothetical protein
MGLFNRKKKQDDDSNDSAEVKKEKGAWRRPASEYLQATPISLLTSVLASA